MVTMHELRAGMGLYRDRVRVRRSALLGDPVAQVLCLPRGADGHRYYERVRARGELVRGRGGLLMTASYAVCGELLRSEHFGVAPSRVSKVHLRAAGANGGSTMLVHPLDDSFVSLNPPEHTRLRKIAAPWFTPRAMRTRRGYVEEIVFEELERLDRGGTVDLIGEFAALVPSRVICELLGLAPRDHERFVRWGIEFGAIVDGVHTPRDLRRTRVLLSEMTAYFSDLLAQRRPRPGDDLLSKLALAVADGEMTEQAALATSEALLIGGFVTTANVIGNGVMALLSNPEQRDAFVADLDLADNVVEEVLRLEAPAQYSVRVARSGASLADREIAPRTPVVALLAAANRDPAVFPSPERFDVTRPNAGKHLSFAAGIHYCIGAGLARMEGAVALRGLFERFPRLRLAGEAQPCPSRVIRGPMRLPVRCC